MILIVDNTKRKMRSILRENLLEKAVPCALSGSDGIDICLPTAACIVTEKYLYNNVSYMTSIRSPSSLCLYSGEDEIFDLVAGVAEELLLRIKEKESQYHLVFNEGEILYCGKLLCLTKTELRILRMLLLCEGWQTKDKIARYCTNDPVSDENSIPVHICNINKKATSVSGRILVEKRRYCGYRLLNDK